MNSEDELVHKYDIDQKTMTFVRPRFPSQRIAEFGVAKDVETFLKEAEAIFKENEVPRNPCIFCLAACLICPLCCIYSCAKKQMKETNQLIERWNDRFQEQGLYLELKTAVQINGQIIGPKPGVELRVNLPRRRQYCAERGLVFTETSNTEVIVVHQPVTNVVDNPPPYYTQEKS